MTQRLMILGAGPTQLPAIERAREMGLTVIAVDGNPEAPGLALADQPVHISILDIPAILRAIKPLNPDGVMTVGSDRAAYVAAQIAHRLGLAGLDPEAANRAHSKLLMRQAFQAHDVPAPRFAAVSRIHEALAAIDDLGLPVIVKPVDNAAQRGVRRLDDMEHLSAAFAEAKRYSRTGTVLVEECIEGPEVTVNSFSLDGKMYPVLVADRVTNPPPYLGIALAHVYPSRWVQPYWRSALDATAKALDALGINQGPGYTQLRIASDGPKIIEVGARIGGGREVELITLLGGPDWITAQIKLALNQPPAPEDVMLPAERRKQAGTIKFIFAKPGIVVAVNGVKQAQKLPNVERVEVRSVPGARIPPMVNAEARQGYLIALGNSRDEALIQAEAAASIISIEVRDDIREDGQ